MTGRAPSGEQITLVRGDQRAVVVEVGGGIRAYDVGDRAVLEPYPAGARCDGAHGAPLLPWPNRLGDGRYRFAGEDQQLALTEPDRGNAIHGLVRWQPWAVRDRDGDAVVVTTHVAPQPGYPHDLDLAVAYALTDDGLTVRTTATNQGVSAAPYGAGHHPYLSPGEGTVDACTLQLRAATRITCDPERLLPTGTEPVAGTPFDLGEATTIGDRVLDDALTDLDLDRDGDGRAWVRLTGADGRTVELWADAAHPVMQLFTGDTLAPARRRRGLAAEPMTCPPDAFRSGEHLIVIAPGEAVTTTWGVRLT